MLFSFGIGLIAVFRDAPHHLNFLSFEDALVFLYIIYTKKTRSFYGRDKCWLLSSSAFVCGHVVEDVGFLYFFHSGLDCDQDCRLWTPPVNWVLTTPGCDLTVLKSIHSWSNDLTVYIAVGQAISAWCLYVKNCLPQVVSLLNCLPTCAWTLLPFGSGWPRVLQFLCLHLFLLAFFFFLCTFFSR